MGEYHVIGDPIDTGTEPAVFELDLAKFIPCVDPTCYGLPEDTPQVDPCAYFITSGDALAKAIKLENDMWALAIQLRKQYARLGTRQGKKKWIIKREYKEYVEAVWKCAGRCRAMVNRLYEAKGPNCFLETEWREQCLVVIPKNPRSKVKDD